MTAETKKKTLDDLRAVHDKSVAVPNRIRAAIAALIAAGEDWDYEGDFLQRAVPRLSTNDLAKYRDQFKDFWADMPATDKRASRRVWFASKKLCDKWKESTGG